MLIICTVAADFVNTDGEMFRVKGNELGIIKEAPNWIEKTLLFKWMKKDGSIQFVTKENKKQAENDPLNGINAEGKKIEENPENKEIEGQKPEATPDADGGDEGEVTSPESPEGKPEEEQENSGNSEVKKPKEKSGKAAKNTTNK